MIDGQKRASLLIDPPDGRVPPLTDAARQRRTTGDYTRPTSDQAAREDDPGFEGPEAYNDPEIRPLAERCLVGFSSTSGPPILPWVRSARMVPELGKVLRSICVAGSHSLERTIALEHWK